MAKAKRNSSGQTPAAKKTKQAAPQQEKAAQAAPKPENVAAQPAPKYSFGAMQFTAPGGGGAKYSVAGDAGLNENITADGAPKPPPIPPQIGPDPRNSVSKVRFEEKPLCVDPSGVRYDFAFGYRILMPSDNRDYLLKIYDLDSGMLLDQFNLKGGNIVIGERKFFVRYRIEVYCEGKMIMEHNYDCSGKKVYIAIPDGGLGDNLAWLPLCDVFARTRHCDVTVVMGEWMILLAGDLYPNLSFLPAASNPKLVGAYANYYCGIFNKDKLNWRPIEHQQLGMQGAVEAILGIPQGPVKCRLHHCGKRQIAEPYVCISTMATNPGKYWNFPDGWNEVIRFLKANGYRVLDLDRDPRLYFAGKEYNIPSEAEDFTGRIPIQKRIDVLEHADFFVGLPSGLSWLAWNLDVPVVMLAGFTMPGCEFPTPYRVTNYLFCHGCWNDSREFFDQNVPVWCPRHVGTPREIECTRAITPKMVIETIQKVPAFQKRNQSRA
ncbi:MAG: autotransporter strand-loop-strand O-heptosyltransferase [Victivallaceae bacterium]|nr:autotransporter strand-loop-strand O-heptosyltransferase [Victivallaceae bacterium]